MIARGPIPIAEALPLFAQIAVALEAAHESGIVHRDLKPANIAIGNDGRVKVLDFGLATSVDAKIASGLSPSDATKPAESPISARVTSDGAVLGTPSYMSPEQARGKPTDKRTDIWAFGCCLFEGITGKIPFDRDTVADTLAAVLESEPNWDLLPKDTPWKIRELLDRCLDKDARYRLRDIGDAWSQIKILTTESGRMTPVAHETEATRRRRTGLWVAAAMVLALLLGIGATVTLYPRFNPAPEVDVLSIESAQIAVSRRFEIDTGTAAPISSGVSADVAISRQGDRVAYTVRSGDGRRLFLRHMESIDASMIPSEYSIQMPFFSPDGDWVAFSGLIDGGLRLMKMPSSGGPAQSLIDVYVAGGVWLADNSILFLARDEELFSGSALSPPRLFRIDANGGAPERVASVDSPQGGHFSPASLPGKETVLFAFATSFADRDVAMLDLQTGIMKIIIPRASFPQYAETGHILFIRNQALWAVPFDLNALEIRGEARSVLQGVQDKTSASSWPYSVSDEGSLVYVPVVPTSIPKRALYWVDHDGREESLALGHHPFARPRVSPDGTRLVFAIENDENPDIWIHERARAESLVRLTFDPADDGNPHWTADSSAIVFASSRNGAYNIFKKRADGVGSAEPVYETSTFQAPAAVSPDGATVIYHTQTPGMDWDLGALSLEGDPNDRIIVQTTAGEGNPSFAPDGKWIVYSIGVAGRNAGELWVRPYPNLDDGRWQLSTELGNEPVWSKDGKEIYYRADGKMKAVSVETDPTFRAGTPRVLFDDVYYKSSDASLQYHLEYPEGKRFLMMKEIQDTKTLKLVFVDNWFDELRRLAPRPRAID